MDMETVSGYFKIWLQNKETEDINEDINNELINSIIKGNLEDFRQRYRYVDVLLVDDIHFLSNKERTQEEFFHTFNTLFDNNKKIIISSALPPSEIEPLESRLCSRFESGLVVVISPPDLKTRIAILQKEAALQNLDIAEDAIIYIADRVKADIRKLKGVLIIAIAYASLNNRQIDVSLANEAIENIFAKNKV